MTATTNTTQGPSRLQKYVKRETDRPTLFHIPGWCGKITLASRTGAKNEGGNVIPGAYYTCRPAWPANGCPGVINLLDLTEEEERGIKANFPPETKTIALSGVDEAKEAESLGFTVSKTGDGFAAEIVVKDEIDLVIERLMAFKRGLNLKVGPPPPQPVDVGNYTSEEKDAIRKMREEKQGEWKAPATRKSPQKVKRGAVTASK